MDEVVLTQILQNYASAHPSRSDDGEEEWEKIQCNEEQKIKLLEVSQLSPAAGACGTVDHTPSCVAISARRTMHVNGML